MPRRLIAAVAFISEFNLLALEVVWTRMLAQVHENSVYSFATVLIVVLVGLSLVAGIASCLALSQKNPKGANLDPETATNFEIGNKLDLFDGNLSITAALFQLDLDNVVSNASDGSGNLVSTGGQRNQGFELSVAGALTHQWNIYANYTYIDAEITKATKDAAAGANVGLVPDQQFSIWTNYALTSHWGFGAGVHGASDKFTSYDNDVVLPGFMVGEVMAYYQGNNYRVQLNVNNVTNRTYYPTASGDDQIMPGAPRSLILSLTMSF